MSTSEEEAKSSGNKKQVKSKELKKRIEGFGNAPMPPEVADSPADVLWGRVSEDQTLMSWYDSARSSVNAMLDAVDDTVNAIADAVDDTIAAVIGEDEEEPPTEPQRPRRGGGAVDAAPGGDRGGQTPQGRNKEGRKKKDIGERSGTDWSKVVGAICVEGDLEEFVMLIRNASKNEFEEAEVADAVADQLLNEVRADATLRILHVMEAIVSDENLLHATDRIRSRCATKLGKLQANSMFSRLCVEVLGDYKKEDRGATNAASVSKDAASASAPSRPPPPPTDLLDMAAPAGATTNGNAAQAPPAKVTVQVKGLEPDDLIGLSSPPVSGSSSAIPIIAPPTAASSASAAPAFRRGQHVRAIWAGNGLAYPAIVESVRGRQVTVQWMRRSANSRPDEAFVCDIGDDTSHETVQLAEVQPLSGAGSVASKANDLLDFDAPSAAAPAAPSGASASTLDDVFQAAPTVAGSSSGNGLLGAMAGLAFNAPAAPAAGGSGPNFANFAAFSPGAGGTQFGCSGGTQANPCGASSLGAARPAVGAGYAALAPSPSASPASTGYAAVFGGCGSFGGASIGFQQQPVAKASSSLGGGQVSPAKKEIQLDDAFSLTGMK